MAEVGSIEVSVLADVENFERNLEQALQEAIKFESRAKQLFGGVSVAAKSMSKDMELTARSTKLFVSEMDKAAQQVVADLARMEAQRKSMAAAFTQKLNMSLGLGGSAPDIASRAADIQAYGNALDDLRAKFVPLFAIQKQYQVHVDEINEAHRIGAITTTEHTQALARAQLQYEANAVAATRLGNNLKINSLQMGNIAAQFNDIAVTMAMGMNSWQIALQQGTQINQVLSGMDFKTAGRTLAGAFKDIISPVSLATFAIIGFGGMAIQWFLNTTKAAKTLEESLKNQLEILKSMGPVYEELGKRRQAAFPELEDPTVGVGRLARERAQAEELMRESIFAQTARLRRSGGGIMDMLLGTGLLSGSTAFGRGMIQQLRLKQQFEPFEDLIRDLENGTISVIEFRKGVNEIGNTNPIWRKAADEILRVSDSLVKLNQQLNQVAKGLQTVLQGPGVLQRRLEQVLGGANLFQRMHPENQFPFTRGRSPEQIQVELLQQQIQLEAQLQDIQARTIVERVAAARALEAARNVEGETKEERAVRANTAAILEQARAERELADAKRDRDRSSREAVENLQLELNLVGKTAAEQAALRFEYERLLQIQHEMEDQGTSIDRYRQEIELLQQRTEAIKQYTQALNRAKLQFDIMTEREEIFMKESEREIRGRIRGAGLDPNMEPALQAQLRYNQELERTRDTWQMIFDEVNSGVDSMVDALFEGGQSFEDTLKQIGRQFARLMFDLAVTNPIKNWLTGSEFKTIADLGIFGKGASSGRGGGFGGALGKLFGADKIATATMQVQAATVIVNGGIPGLPGGIPGLPGADGGGGGGGGGPTDIAQKYIQSRIDSAFGTKPSSASTSGQNYIQTRIDQAFSSITGGGGGGGGGGGNWLNYINQSATRNLPLSPKLVEQMSFLQDMGIRMDVFSGGQPAFGAGRVGSHRHDLGGAADVFFSKGGRRLDWANAEDVPIFQEIVSRAKARGVTGFGAGEGYMQPGSMHIGGGPEAVWGRGGSGANAPSWLRDAASGQGGMSQASQAIDTMTTSATNAASSLAKVGLSGFETVKGLTDAAGGLTQFGNILKNFMAPGGGSEAGWFQSLIKGAGSLFGGGPAGAVSYMQSISPAATSAILSGAGGLYQQGGFTGGSDRRGIAGLVHQKEFVFDADSTQRIGVHNLEKIRRSKLPGAVPTPPTWSANAMWRSNGGGGGGGLGGSNATKIINVFDPTVVGDYLSTDAGEKMVMNVMRRNPSGRGGASG